MVIWVSAEGHLNLTFMFMWYHFRIIRVSSCSHLGIILRSFVYHRGVIFGRPGSSLDHVGLIFWIIRRYFLDYPGIIFGHLGAILGSSGSHFGIIWESFWNHVRINEIPINHKAAIMLTLILVVFPDIWADMEIIQTCTNRFQKYLATSIARATASSSWSYGTFLGSSGYHSRHFWVSF